MAAAWRGHPLDHLDDGPDSRVRLVHLSRLHVPGLQACGDAARGFLWPSRLHPPANRLAASPSPRQRYQVVEFCVRQAEHHGNERLVTCLAEVDLSRHLVGSLEAATRDENQEHAGLLDAPPDVLDVGAEWQAVELVAPGAIPVALEVQREL